jgi:hypothetical protein
MNTILVLKKHPFLVILMDQSELNELRNIVTNMALLHKKTMKRASSENRSKGSGTKVIVVPQQVSGQNKPTDDYMEKLRKSIFD